MRVIEYKNTVYDFIKKRALSDNVKLISGIAGSGKSGLAYMISEIFECKVIVFKFASPIFECIYYSENPIKSLLLNNFKTIDEEDILKINLKDIGDKSIYNINYKKSCNHICKNLISLFSNLNENIVLILDEIPINEEEIIMFKNNKKINLFFTSQMPIDSFKKVNNLIDIFLFRGDNHLNLDFLEVLDIENKQIYNLKSVLNYRKIFNIDEFSFKPIIDKFSIIFKEDVMVLYDNNYKIIFSNKYINNKIKVLSVFNHIEKKISHFNLDLSINEFKDFLINEYYKLGKEVYKLLTY